MTTVLLIFAVLTLLIFLNALYVAGEFSAVSSRRTRISQLAGSGNRFAKMLLPIVEDSRAIDRYVAACQLGITASSLILGAYGTNVIAVRLIEPIAYILERIAPRLGGLGIASQDVASAIATTIAVTGVLLFLTFLPEFNLLIE